MIRLNFPTEPYWLELGGGVRLKVNPPSTVLFSTANAAARRELEELRAAQKQLTEVGAKVEGLPDLLDPNVADGHLEALTTRSFARYAIVEWQGVTLPDGTPAPVTRENIDKLMAIAVVARTFLGVYLVSIAELEAEGNGSAPVPNGSSATGASTATTAEPSVAAAA